MTNLTIVYNNPHKRVGKLRFALVITNRNLNHYMSYTLSPRQDSNHWFVFRRNNPQNPLILKELENFS